MREKTSEHLYESEVPGARFLQLGLIFCRYLLARILLSEHDMAVLLEVALSPLTHLASSRIIPEDTMASFDEGIPARVLPEPTDASDRALLADVRAHGYHLLTVAGDKDGPTYTFTIGLVYTFNHPEILVMGKAEAAAHLFLNGLVRAIRGGRRFAGNQTYTDALDNSPVAFVPIPLRHYRDYIGYAMWLYRSMDFLAIQALYPDAGGTFPSDPAADTHVKAQQPILEQMP